MKAKAFVLGTAILGLIGLATTVRAEETAGEKATATGKSAMRQARKGANRLSEGLCGKLTGDSKTSCLAKEAKHRVTEGKDTVVDKASEVKNAADSDKK